MNRRIVTIFDAGDSSVLHTPAVPVDASAIDSKSVRELIKDLGALMKKARGVGIAAPQIGVSQRVALIDRSATQTGQPLVLINPLITKRSAKQVDFEEGCLSVPNVFGMVARPETVEIKTLDMSGQTIVVQADGLLARVIQHEIDHLDGVLFTERASRITHGQELLS